MISPVFISFFTDNWLYPELARQLIDDCDRFGLEYDICQLEGTGGWTGNTALKADFVYRMLKKHEWIVWIDADSRMLKYPLMLTQQSEPLLLRRHSTLPSRNWHVGVMGIRRTKQTLAVCRAWAARVRENGGTDEACFDDVIRKYSIKTGTMPVKYHALPDEVDLHTVIAMGLSKDKTKMAMKKRLALRKAGKK